jgi:hypothetical protein
MARIVEPTAEQWAAWTAWVAERPEAVRLVAERFDPWSLYRMKSTGHRVTIHSFGEQKGPTTLTVDIAGKFNAVVFERQVFGIDPNGLEPCDLPGPEVPTGAMLTEEADIKAFVAATR